MLTTPQRSEQHLDTSSRRTQNQRVRFTSRGADRTENVEVPGLIEQMMDDNKRLLERLLEQEHEYRSALDTSQQRIEQQEKQLNELRQSAQANTQFEARFIRPYFQDEIERLVELRSEYEGIKHDKVKSRRNLLQQLDASSKILSGINSKRITRNIQMLRSRISTEQISWVERMFGDELLFAKFLDYEQDLFDRLQLTPHASAELRKILRQTQEHFRSEVQMPGDEQFSDSVRRLQKEISQIQQQEAIRLQWHSVYTRATRTLSAVVTVANVAGSITYPLLSNQFYAASVTLGGLGLTLISKD